jgi:protocatechuate 3,4-dioxygenase beta subunit
MRFWPAFGLAAVIFTTVGFSPRAQTPQVIRQGPGQMRPGAPPRDTQAEEKTGTAIIKGKVLAAETGSPLRRAQIRLLSPELRGGRVATTDADGRYEFKDLPAGRYSLTVSKAGYVAMQYGQRRPFESGKPIEIVDTQVVGNADFKLPRGSAINGRILDEFGEPVADAFVQAMQYQYVGGRRQLVPTGRGGQSNDLGQYRIYGLPPGDYFVSASVRDAAMLSLEAGLMGGRADTTSYAPTYYPGTPSVAEAQRLNVAVGQEASSVDFSLLPVRTARVSGVTTDSEGKPLVNAMVMLMPRGLEGMTLRFGGGGGRVGKDGAFAISNVAPGDYVLQVRSGGGMFMEMSAGSGTAVTATAISVSGEPGQPPRPEPEFAYMAITVTGQDITGISLVTNKGGRITGRVIWEDGAAPDRSLWENMRIGARAADMDFSPIMTTPPAPVREDGSFEVRGVAGNVLIRPFGPPRGWTLKAVEYNGSDVTDESIEFKGTEEATGVRVILTALSTQVAGAVTDDNAKPVADYTMVVFAEDNAKWGPQSRFIAVGRPDQDGRFKVSNLPPGSYLAIAVDYVQQGEWYDPAFLERVKSHATAFQLGAGETRALDLKIQAY